MTRVQSRVAAEAAWLAYHRQTGLQPTCGSLQDLLCDLIAVHEEYTGERPYEVVAAVKEEELDAATARLDARMVAAGVISEAALDERWDLAGGASC